MTDKWPIFISRHFDFYANLKNLFPKGIFNEILLKLENHEYINITDIIFWYFYAGVILGANHFPRTPPPMLTLC